MIPHKLQQRSVCCNRAAPMLQSVYAGSRSLCQRKGCSHGERPSDCRVLFCHRFLGRDPMRERLTDCRVTLCNPLCAALCNINDFERLQRRCRPIAEEVISFQPLVK